MLLHHPNRVDSAPPRIFEYPRVLFSLRSFAYQTVYYICSLIAGNSKFMKGYAIGADSFNK
jgi:hypothetical protein